MSKIKVAHIITQLELGGAQENTLYTVTHLDPQVYDCFLIAGKGGLLDEKAVSVLGTKAIFVSSLVRAVHPWNDLVSLFVIYRLCRKEKFDLVHTHSSKAGILGRWAAKLAGVKKIIHTFHGFGFNDFQKPWTRWFFIWAERVTAVITAKLVVVSAENTKKALDCKIGQPAQYVVIHSGIKVSDYLPLTMDKARARKKIGLAENAPLVGMVACLKPQKAPLDFIRIAQLVKIKKPQVKFILIGDGDLRPAIEDLIKKLFLENTVLLLGWREDVPALIKLMDVCVLTSLWEGLPRVILEAFVSGIPMVATPADGTREVIKDGLTGFLVDFHDLESFAAKIIVCLEDPEKSKKIIENAAQLVTGSFNIEIMVQEIAHLYERLGENKYDR
ncbi:MAG: glycosyltransferase family 4 protein [Elusimicrobia bacterium]|nr:glycosyltransferase family 4 protein [Elusimicrobiota bacterium]